jgi:predicted alpha/beta-hydrolase family hydrolase
MDGLGLFTHSHGGSAAMLATQAGMNVGELVLLSCPVHAHKYYPEFGHAKRIVSIRVRMDLVILADRGGQRFKDARIEENVLPVWFNHSASHDPKVWQDHDVPRMI